MKEIDFNNLPCNVAIAPDPESLRAAYDNVRWECAAQYRRGCRWYGLEAIPTAIINEKLGTSYQQYEYVEALVKMLCFYVIEDSLESWEEKRLKKNQIKVLVLITIDEQLSTKEKYSLLHLPYVLEDRFKFNSLSNLGVLIFATEQDVKESIPQNLGQFKALHRDWAIC
jgi:hypothetical protein